MQIKKDNIKGIAIVVFAWVTAIFLAMAVLIKIKILFSK